MTPQKVTIGGADYIEFEIGGVKHTLAYDFNKICEAEELTGCNLLAALTHLSSLSAAELRGLFYAALEAGPKHAFPGRTPQESLEEAGNMIRIDTILPIGEALSQAYGLTLAESQEEEIVGA